MNLAAVTYWSTEEPFIDRIHTGGGWVARDSAGNDITATLAHSADGDITDLTNVKTLGVAVAVDPKSAAPIDEYVLTYTGTAKIGISGATIVSQTAGKVVFDYTGRDERADVVIQFANLDPAHPIDNVHVVRADQVNLFNSGEIFNPDFVAKVSQWGVVRFMDWGATNASDTVSWSTRNTVQDTFWSTSQKANGVPLEVMVKLANEAHVDMWYNMPTKADDDYVTKALTYIRDHLDPSLKVHVEWSNEVWNTGFAANAYAQQQANSLWGNGGTVSGGSAIYYGYRSAQIANIANHVFTGSHAGQLEEVLAGHNDGASTMKSMLQGVAKAGLGSTASLFDEYAIAPYFGSNMGTAAASADLQTILGWAKGGAAGLDAAFHELEFGGTLSKDSSLNLIDAVITRAGKLASDNGLSLVTYEAGTSFATTKWAAADKPAIQDLFNRMFADPRMGALYAKEIATFKAAGGTIFSIFNDTGSGNDTGTWGSLASIYSDGSARYNAWLASAGHSVSTVAPGATHDAASTDTSSTVTGSTGTDTSVAAGSGTSTGTTDTGTATTGSTTHDAPVTPIATSGHILGTSGDDHLTASNVNDTVDGADGNDSIVGSSSTTDDHGHYIETDLYMGGGGADTIVGGDGNDHIYGNEMSSTAGAADGADVLSGGAGNDYIQGNAGNDTIDGGSGSDRLYGGAGNDVITGGSGNDYLQGNKGADDLSGGDGNDTVHGGADDDLVRGDAGDDQLYGDAGNDVLVGGLGIDKLTGGAGNDTFVFSGHDAAFATSGTAAWHTDEVTDFTHGSDKFMFDFTPAQVLGGSAATVDAALMLANSLTSAHNGQSDVAAITVGNDTYLFWDASGHGGAIDSAVKVDNVHDTFAVSDFA